MKTLFNDNSRGAILSTCGRYRYQLWRIWNHNLPLCMFVMHNPSTADHEQDDPTIRRCIGFAKGWGYGGIYVGNLIPYRATKPSDLLKLKFHELVSHAYTANTHLKFMINKCSMHVLAYGNPVYPNLKGDFSDSYWHYLTLTKSGNPGHPLYIKKTLTPKKFNNEDNNINGCIMHAVQLY